MRVIIYFFLIKILKMFTDLVTLKKKCFKVSFWIT